MNAANTTAGAGGPIRTGERAELLETIRKQRGFFTYTVRGLDDEQAARRTTVSELCLGGLVKHLAAVEKNWVDFIVEGPVALERQNPDDWPDMFRMLDGETLEGLLAAYHEVARRTDELVATVDLDASQPLPAAPWFEPGARWSARRVLLHIVAETAQHSGHADIIRESLDGQKTMG